MFASPKVGCYTILQEKLILLSILYLEFMLLRMELIYSDLQHILFEWFIITI